MAERGVIRNREHAQQIRDFSGLRFGSITPTDIDGFLEFQDRLFIFIESKFGDSTPPRGQELAFERLCDACEQHGHRKSVVLMLKHSILSGSGLDIEFGGLVVTRYRLRGKWRVPKAETTCRQAIDLLLAELQRTLNDAPKPKPAASNEPRRAAEFDVMQGFGIDVDF